LGLLEPGLVPKRQWRPVTGTAAGTPNIQCGAVGRRPEPVRGPWPPGPAP